MTLRGDDVHGFDTRWSEVLLSTHEVPAESVLESSNKMRMCRSDQLQIVLALNEQDFNKTTQSQATRD